MKKKINTSPVYTCDYPVYDYEDNSVYIVIYYNGKKVKILKKEDAPSLVEALETGESPEDIDFHLSTYL
ncbi:hypothetical protein NIES4071_107850 (plasmid) [Calothrix sp. NIES-4071]|nr:hypothetical protein NIES4071_107850 [Calothrix sp. NIES-4071]BAZ64825.1 hypothetical protein NIES4105_105580 [Calothrix sp. NIES-4105]